MKSTTIFLALLIFSFFNSSAQTLFGYAGKSVTKNEYLKAFNKVYPAPVSEKPKKIREYLDLYINSKLKIQEALDRGYDSLPGFMEEYGALRNQVLENYMTDYETLDKLTEEAFDRSQKDIKIQHIYIPYTTTSSFSDSQVVKLKIQEAYMELQSGKSFEEVAMKYSGDPTVNSNKGVIGYITVFSLPYQFENIIYKLSPGKFSSPYRSNSGFHIFKNLGERKAVGRMKAAQILLAVPPGSDAPAKNKIKLLVDSIYNRLQKGDDFSKLARQFSNDVVSSASGGTMPEFGLGTYDPEFENAVYSLPSDGALSKPFLTNHGYHIVKRISIDPPPSVKNKKNLDAIRSLVEKDNRVNVAKDKLYQRVLDKAGFKQFNVDQKLLQDFLDSVFAYKSPAPANPVNKATALFSVGQSTKMVGDLITYGMGNRFLADGSGVKPLPQIIEEFKRNTVMEYYRDHLEDFNEEFKAQMKELKEGNLFFDIMMKEVWSKAQSDTLGQKNYFEKNKAKYRWNYSADAVIFYCGDDASAKSFRDILVKDPGKWKDLLENYSDKITSDSGRFEITKIAGAQKATAKNGTITPVLKNKDDNSASFAMIFKIYPTPGQKTFVDARGDVISDYQDDIDKRWVAELKKKYTVKINDDVLKSISK